MDSWSNTFIRVSGIVNDSIADGPGLRLTVFTQGCPHKCEGCHNPQTHPLDGGKLVSIEEILDIIDKNELLDGVTFSGGEPFLQAEALYVLAEQIKKRGLSLIIYTGYTWKELTEDKSAMPFIEMADYIIDGKFEESKKSLDLDFRGSANQRIIDVKKSFLEGNIVTIKNFS